MPPRQLFRLMLSCCVGNALLVRFVTVLLGSALVAGCGAIPGVSSTTQENVVVFAASSLQDAFNDMASGLQEQISYNFAGSQVLVTQLREGAQADVLATADRESMDAAISAGVVEPGSERVLALNSLVVATAPGSSMVTSLDDLAKPGVKLVLAEPSVPAGKYALEVLDKLAADPAYGGEFKERVVANVASRESNVRQTLAKVRLGEADAGIVYASDALLAGRPGEMGKVDIPARYNVTARYYIAPVKGTANYQMALLFVGYALSEEGQRTLARHGFGAAAEK